MANNFIHQSPSGNISGGFKGLSSLNGLEWAPLRYPPAFVFQISSAGPGRQQPQGTEVTFVARHQSER